MTEKFRFLDALTYGIRTLFWRPVRAAAYIAAIAVLYAGYMAWMQSESGQAMFADYLLSTQSLAQGRFDGDAGLFAAIIAGSVLFSLVTIAGAYRVFVRDEPVWRLPVQLGFDELRTFGVYILISLIGIGVMLLSMIPVFILFGVAGFITAQMGVNLDTADQTATATLGAVLVIFVLVPWMLFYFYVLSRLSVGLALTIRDRKFRLGGWNASKGAGLQLLFAHIVLYIALFAAQFALAPDMAAMVITAMTDPMAAQDPAVMASIATNPYGSALWLAIPVQTLMSFLLFGPTAAVANWDARKRAAAEAPTMQPAPGVGTGEVSA